MHPRSNHDAHERAVAIKGIAQRLWRRLGRRLSLGGALLACLWTPGIAIAAEDQLNLYSSRHYPSDHLLYQDFKAESGISVKVLEGKADDLILRLKSEGRLSQGDVLLTTDIGRLQRAADAGLCAPMRDAVIAGRLPAAARDPEDRFFALTQRVRMIFYNRANPPDPLPTRYEDLADPRYRGALCLRRGQHVYNQTLLASLIATNGAAAAEAWVRGVKDNLARPAQGGDTDQLRALAAGGCQIAMANSYYFVRLLKTPQRRDTEVAPKIGWIFPNQAVGDHGAHVNISGACRSTQGPNPEAARLFLRYLTSPTAQRIFADENNEYPTALGVKSSKALASLGPFRVQDISFATIAKYLKSARTISDRVGWF